MSDIVLRKILEAIVAITSDINVDTTSVDTTGLIGKASGGDFTTAWGSAEVIDCTGLPASYHPNLSADDIVTIVQINDAGEVVETYSRDDAAMTVATNSITVVGAAFLNTDTFVLYTNIERYFDSINLEMVDGQDVDVGVGNAGLGTLRMSIADDDTNLTALLAALLAKVSAGNEVTHRSPQHFNAEWTSGDTLTLSGSVPTITNNAQIVKIVQIKADNTSAVWTQGENCTLTHAGGVITIHGESPFVTGDDYAVCLSIMQHALDTTQDVIKGSEQSPAKEWYTDFEDYTTFAPDSVAFGEGGVISTAANTEINFEWSKTASDADNNYIKVVYLDDSGSAVDHQEASIGSPVAGVTQVYSNVYEVDKASGVSVLTLSTKGYPFMRIDIAKATDTGTDSTWTTRVNKRWR